MDKLSEALKLGYLKVCRQDDVLVDAYLTRCLERRLPSVLLYPDRGRSWVISYRLPPLRRWITDEGISIIRRHVGAAEQSGEAHRRIICGNGGELTGLFQDKAEAIAFRIADVANDRDLTKPHAP